MKQHRIYLSIGALVLASLACQAAIGGRNNSATAVPPSNNNATQPSDVQPTKPASDNGSSNSSVKTDFPLTADAYNITQVGDDNIVYFTKMSVEDVMQFYRDQYASKGYTERKVTTSLKDGILNLVFDGDPSGKAVVIQSVGLADGSRSVSIRLESV